MDRRTLLAGLAAGAVPGLAGCNTVKQALPGTTSGDDEEEDKNPFEPTVAAEPLPGDVPLMPGLSRIETEPYLRVDDHRAVSAAHMEYLAAQPAFRYHDTVLGATYDSGATVEDWAVEGDLLRWRETPRETVVTDAAYLKTQTTDATNWHREPRTQKQAFEQYSEYSEYFAADAHVQRLDADSEYLDAEAGKTVDKTMRYSPDTAEQELRDGLKEVRDPQFGLVGDIYDVERVDEGVKVKTYRDRRAPSSDNEKANTTTDIHDFYYWVFDDAGFIRERQQMYVYPQDEERLSVSDVTKRWAPMDASPAPLRPDWVADAREWEYPESWYEKYDGPRDA